MVGHTQSTAQLVLGQAKSCDVHGTQGKLDADITPQQFAPRTEAVQINARAACPLHAQYTCRKGPAHSDLRRLGWIPKQPSRLQR
jgi:hypothetical protein